MVPYTDDGSYAQGIVAAEGESVRAVPVIEAREAQLPKWDSLTSTSWPTAPAAADRPLVSPLVISGDDDGRIAMHFAAPGAGVLVLNEQYYPGGEATVNGAKQEVFRIDTIAQGVLIPDRGNYQVQFEYVGSLRRDIEISICGLTLMFFACTSLPRTSVGRRHPALAA